VDEELDDDILGDEYMSLQDTFNSEAAALPAVQLPSEPSKPSANMAFNALDFKVLVRQRKQHQTRQAANSARVKTSKPDEDGSSTAPVESTRRQILRRYHELLKEDQSKAVGTAVERQARWSTDPKPTAGNATNAAATAAAVATKVGRLFCFLSYVTHTEPPNRLQCDVRNSLEMPSLRRHSWKQ
jgi:hypothetical protein